MPFRWLFRKVVSVSLAHMSLSRSPKLCNFSSSFYYTRLLTGSNVVRISDYRVVVPVFQNGNKRYKNKDLRSQCRQKESGWKDPDWKGQKGELGKVLFAALGFGLLGLSVIDNQSGSTCNYPQIIIEFYKD